MEQVEDVFCCHEPGRAIQLIRSGEGVSLGLGRPLLGVLAVVLLSAIAGCGGGGAGTVVSTGVTTNGLLSARDLLQFGDVDRARGELDEALVLYRRLVAEFPSSAFVDDAYMGIGGVFLAKNDFQRSMEAFSQAIAAGGDRLPDAKLALGRAYVAQFNSVDGGTQGFIDPTAAGEFLANLRAIEAFRDAADDTVLPADRRLEARKELGDALFRAQRFPEARTEFAKVITGSQNPIEIDSAWIQTGLAFVQESNSKGAIDAFIKAGALGTASSPLGSEAARPQVGGFSGPPVGFISLAELVIVVRRSLESQENTDADLAARAELGRCLTLALVDKDLPEATKCLEALVARGLPVPVGDLARFQLGEVRRNNQDPDGAIGEYQAVVSDFPGSPFAQRAHQRIGEILFAVFGSEAGKQDVVDNRLIANLEASLRKAVGDGPEPVRDARRLALNLLGRLDSEGIPVALTIAMSSGLPRGFAGTAYEVQMTSFGGTGPFTWSLASGSSLPGGLSLSAAGMIFGIPLEKVNTVVSISVKDSAGAVDTRPFPIAIEPFQVLAPNRLIDAIVGQPYSFQIESRGVAPFAYDLVQVTQVRNDGRPADVLGGIPGITLSSTGMLAGTPTTSSGSNALLLAIRARDGKAREQVFFVNLFVANPIVAAKPGLLMWPPGNAQQSEPGGDFSGPVQRDAVSAATSFVLTTVDPIAAEVVITPDGKNAVVINGFFTESITVVDLETGATRSAPLPPPLVFGKLPFAVDVSFDGRFALVGEISNTQGQMHLIDLTTLKAIKTVETGVRTQAVEFTPDGRMAVSRSSNKVVSLDLSSLTTKSFSIADVGDGRSLAMLPDSRRIVVAGERESNLAVVIDLATGNRITFVLPTGAVFARVLPGGEEVMLSARSGSHLFLLNLRTGIVESLLVGQRAERFALSLDGKVAAVPSAGSNELAIVDVVDQRVRRISLPLGGLAALVDITPDGRTAIVFPGAGKSVFLVDTSSLDVRIVEGFGGTVSQSRNRTAVSPDGSQVLGLGGLFPSRSSVARLHLASAPVSIGLVRKPLPEAVVGVSVAHQFEARGGQPSYSFGPGSLVKPVPSLTLSASGKLSGAPSAPGLFALEASVSDSTGTSTAFSVPLLVREVNQSSEPISLVTRELTAASVGIPYLSSLSVVGGQRPYTYSVTAGVLPTGIGLSAAGRLSGTAVQTTTAVIVVQVSDARMSTTTRQLTLEVGHELEIDPIPSVIDLLAPANDLLAVDLNNDGRDDLAVAHQSATTNLAVYLANETGAFGSPMVVTVEDIGQPGSLPAGSVKLLRSGDFNGDGNKDLSVKVSPGLGTQGSPLLRPVVVPLLGDGKGSLTLFPAPDIPQVLVSHTVGDLNSDGWDDIVASSGLNNARFGVFATTYIQISNGDGTFSEQGPVVTSSPLQILQRPLLAELTGDGNLDLAALVRNPVSGFREIRVYEGDGTGNLALGRPSVVQTVRTLTAEFETVISADLNGDGKLDLIAREGTEIVVGLATGAGTFAPFVTVFSDALAGNPVVADLGAGGSPDLVIPVRAADPDTARDGQLVILPGLGDGTFDLPLRVTGNLSSAQVVIGDVTGDQVQDVCVIDSEKEQVMVFRGRRIR